MHAVQSEIRLNLQIKQVFQCVYVFNILNGNPFTMVKKCCDRKGDTSIGLRPDDSSVLRRAEALSVEEDHLAIDIFKRAKSDIAVLQQFAYRNDRTGISKCQSLQCRYLKDLHQITQRGNPHLFRWRDERP